MTDEVAPQISAIVLTLNEEKNLPDCLSSLRGVADEVFVVDSGSTDGTREIAARYGAKVVEHPFENYSSQRNWAIDNLPIASDWVLHLDADERLTPALADEIRLRLPKVPADIAGFLLRKRTIFLGRWIRHGGHYPSYHLRLFRRGRGRCEDRLYDQHFLVDGTVDRLSNDYLDVLTPDLDRWTERHLAWAKLEAEEISHARDAKDRVQSRASGTPIERRRWQRERLYGQFPLFIRPFLYFIYRYFVRLGFLDGKEGLIFHFLQGCWFRFMVDVGIDDRLRAARRI